MESLSCCSGFFPSACLREFFFEGLVGEFIQTFLQFFLLPPRFHLVSTSRSFRDRVSEWAQGFEHLSPRPPLRYLGSLVEIFFYQDVSSRVIRRPGNDWRIFLLSFQVADIEALTSAVLVGSLA